MVAIVALVVVALLPNLSGSSRPAAAQSTPKVVPASLRVRAFGDGVTAGFGMTGSGSDLPISDALECRSVPIDDGGAMSAGTRCSSNGSNGPGSAPDEVSFSADFGADGAASWAAKVAKDLGAVDFANYAVSGSTLVGWLNLPRDDAAPAEGAQHELLERIELDDPDIVLATLGGESLLQQSSPAVRQCALWSDSLAQRNEFTSCVGQLLDRQLVKQRLMAISFDVLAHTQNAKLLFATYLPASPRFSFLLPWQQEALASSISGVIGAAVQGVAESGLSWGQRIDVSTSERPSNRCDVGVLPGPRFLGPTWFTPPSACTVNGDGAVTDPRSFTPVSLGTVPGTELQRALARTAVERIRARGWS